MMTDHHTGPLLVGLTGLAGTGKDTVAEHLVAHHGFVHYAFADPIRDMLAALLVGAGFDQEHLSDRARKEQPLPYLGVSPRQMMQRLGTEWGRGLNPDMWVTLAALNLGLNDPPRSSPVHDRIVITDVRFLNESAWVHSIGGHLVRVARDVPAVATHVSEQFVHAIEPCYVIDNTGGMEQLYHQVDALVAQLTF